MSLDTIFTTGSLAKGYRDIAAWYGEHWYAVGAETIFNPFFGFGRIASAMCQGYTHTDSCDFQRLSSAIANGVFGAGEYQTNIDKPRFLKGAAVAGEFSLSTQPDLRSAGFIDYVVRFGTELDIACLGMVLPGQTMRGWLGTWTGNFDSLWEKFCSTRQACMPQIPMPGGWRHYEADVFKLIQSGSLAPYYDCLAIDPPRLLNTQDSYSYGWRSFNHILGGTVDVQPFTRQNYMYRLQQLFSVPSKYVLFSWTEGRGYPLKDDIQKFLQEQGRIQDYERWITHGKRIHGWVIQRP